MPKYLSGFLWKKVMNKKSKNVGVVVGFDYSEGKRKFIVECKHKSGIPQRAVANPLRWIVLEDESNEGGEGL